MWEGFSLASVFPSLNILTPLGGWSVVFPRSAHRSAHGLHRPVWEDRSTQVGTGLHRKTCEDRGRPCASCWEDPLTSLQLRHCVHCHAKRANAHWQSAILSKLCLASWASATPYKHLSARPPNAHNAAQHKVEDIVLRECNMCRRASRRGHLHMLQVLAKQGCACGIYQTVPIGKCMRHLMKAVHEALK